MLNNFTNIFLLFLIIKSLYGPSIQLQTSECQVFTNYSYPTRYIKIMSSSTNTLNFSQIACYDINNFNVVYGKKVTASQKGAEIIDPNIVTDGNKYARAFPEIYLGMPNVSSYVEIDLGREFRIYKCVVYNRIDRDQDSIIDSQVQLFRTDRNYRVYSVIKTSSYEIEVFFVSDRYIKLQAPNIADHVIQISQIACFDYNGNNVAFQKPVTASSVYFNYANITSIVTDGVLSARPYPNILHTNNDSGDHVIIDLRSTYQIKRCEYYNRSDTYLDGCCNKRIIGSTLKILNSDGSTSKSFEFNTGDMKIDVDFS
jgi:hypothetical protein